MQIVASTDESDLVWLVEFSIIAAEFHSKPYSHNDDRQMLRSLKYLFGAGIVLVANPTMIFAGDVANVAGEGVKDTTTSLITTISNAFQPGEVGAAAHKELWDLAAKATFVIAVIFIAYIVASYIGRVIGGVVTKRVDVTLGKFLTKAIRNIILLITAMVVLQTTTGTDLSAFAAILAAAGFAVGMALSLIHI